MDMYMHPRLFAREEEQPKSFRAENSRTHKFSFYARAGSEADAGA